MKRIPRKTLSLLLLTLFAVGLLAAPASADEVVGEVEPPAPGDEVSEEVEVPAYIEALFNDSAESFLAEVYGAKIGFRDEVSEDVELPPWMEDCIESTDYAALFGWSEQTAANEPMCSHSKEVLPPVVTSSPKNANEHYKVEIHKVYCRICDKYWISSESRISELHVYNPYRQYAGSNHTGHYTLHTYSYRYTCAACGYAKIDTFPTGCTAYSCVEPQSFAPPIETCSDDMIFGIYLD